MLNSTFLFIQNGHLYCHEEECLGRDAERQSNIPVLTDRCEPPPDLPHSHLNNERRAGVMSNLSVRYRRGQASIARHGSRPALACWKSPQVLRNCPEGCVVGIKSLGLTELCCLCVNMPKVLSVTLCNFSLRGK